MTKEEILENNRLIAVFCGYEWDKEYPNTVCMFTEQGYGLELEELKYHSSYDWLMPVVEKIEKLGFWFNIKKNHVTVAWDNKNTFDSKMIHSEFGDLSKIERIYSCAISFIKWHNKNNNNDKT